MPELIRDLYYISILSLLSFFDRQNLKRTPEPDQVTTNPHAVNEYDDALRSTLLLLYALNIKILKKLFPLNSGDTSKNKTLLDLACGPAVFGELACKSLSIQKYTGVDLSIPMLDKAKSRFQKSSLPIESTFLNCDITHLPNILDQSQDIISIMDCAHHFNSTEEVSKVIAEAERKVKANGILLISDLVRPKSQRIATLYYQWLSKKNERQNLTFHNLDFKNSIFASFTVDELLNVIPEKSNRSWYLLTPIGFQYTQILISLEKERPLVLYDLTFKDINFIPSHLKTIWHLTAISFRLSCRVQKIR